MTLKYDVKGRGTSSEAVAAVDKLHAGQLGPGWNAQKPETLAAQVLPAPPRGKKLEGLLEKPPDFSNEVIFTVTKSIEKFIKAIEKPPKSEDLNGFSWTAAASYVLRP